MRIPSTIVAVLASAVGLVPAAAAQTDAPLLPAEIAAACAPPGAATSAAHALRVIGAQDTTPRSIFDDRDLLVINGGTGAGVQLGAVFFVRRAITPGTAYAMGNPSSVVTDGWIRIVSVNETTAIARAEHLCDAIFANDFLEPYVRPHVAVDSLGADPAVDPDFEHLARVVSGPAGRPVVATGEFATLELEPDSHIQPGTRVAIYRDLTDTHNSLEAAKGTPLTAIGEAIVVSTSGNRALARIVRARDAVTAGDYAAPQK